MKVKGRLKFIILGFVLLAVASLVVGQVIFSSAVFDGSHKSVPSLHTSGKELYDSNNNKARLFLTVIFDGHGYKLSEADIQNIASMGFKGIRFFVYWGLIQPNADTINTEYFSSGKGEPGENAVDNIVNWSRDAGLYILLCPGWSETFQPPSWAQSSSGMTSWGGGSSVHVDILNNPTVKAGIANLYAFMAQRYASYSNVAFESFNELASESSPMSSTDRQLWADFNNKWITAIEVNEGQISHIKVLQICYDGSAWSYCLNGPVLSGIHSNVILATHSYSLVRGDTASLDTRTQCASYWSSFIHNLGYPWMDTEFSQNLGGGFTGLKEATDLLVKDGAVGWGYFDYEYSGNSVNTANVNNPTNAASILPILQPIMKP